MSTSDRRAALRERLIALARAQIESGGLPAVKARDLAKDAGCSVGAIYNVFGDLNDLVMAVNGQTFQALGAHVLSGLKPFETASPVDRLIAMSDAYLSFATEHPRLWRALFEIEMQAGGEVPDWYLEALDGLLQIIDGPVKEVFPDLDDAEVRVRTRALFSSVHGIVLLGVERRISAVDHDRLPDMLRFMLRGMMT